MFTFGAKANPKIAIAPGQIRVEKALPTKKPEPLPSKTTSRHAPSSRGSIRPRPSESTRPATPHGLGSNTARKRKAARQKSPAQLKFDESSSEDDVGSPAPNYSLPDKRQRSNSPVDLKRQLVADSPFSAHDAEVLIHATDVANRNDYSISVELQYPAATVREK